MCDLSATSLVVKLMTSPGWRRGKWQSRKFRLMFLLRCGLYPLATFRYLRALCDLEDIHRLLAVNPTLPAKPHRPYLHRGGSVRTRAQAVLDHYHAVQAQPEGVRQILTVSRETLLCRLAGRQGGRLDITCSPCGFDREGELMLILRYNDTVITRLSFSLIRCRGRLTLFIGGLQGPARGEGTDIIRRATRECHGLFPRRVLCEALSVLAQLCRVDGVVAVSETRHVLRQLRYFYRKKGRFVARYSECWRSVGGRVREDGDYDLPVVLPRREAADIPARKRAEYRRRNDLLGEVRDSLTARARHDITATDPYHNERRTDID
ncbi:TPA: VirK/YbjX family protein [Salmonella enterica subsp. enterica serovar Virchow]